MAIPATTVNAVLSVVNGLVRLVGRVDRIMAEEEALRGELAIGAGVAFRLPHKEVMKRALRDQLAATAGRTPDPLEGRREAVARALSGNPSQQKLLELAEELLPGHFEPTLENPDAAFLAKLREARSAWDLDDPDIRRTAFYLRAGEDLREASATWQIATTVVEVLADLALENQDLLLRDERARPVLAAVLERLADADLSQVGSHRVFLRAALKATVNGTLDAADSLRGDKAWLNGLLGALAHTREQAGDDFVTGLVRGEGYPVLVGNLLAEGAASLTAPGADAFEDIAGRVLARAGELAGQQDDLHGFLETHWGPLLQAGLEALHANGAVLLEGRSPLLQEGLLAALEALAEADHRELLNADALQGAVEAAIGAVVVEPALLDRITARAWLQQVIESVGGMLSEDLERAFTRDGLDGLVRDVLAELAAQPELLVHREGAVQILVGSLLESLAAANHPRLEEVAAAGVEAVLEAVAESPDLLDTRYPELVAALARELAGTLEDRRITRQELADVLAAAVAVVAEHPRLVTGDQGDLAARVLGEALKTLLAHRGTSVTGPALRPVAAAVLETLASDPAAFDDRPQLVSIAIAAVLDHLAETLRAAHGSVDLRIAPLATAGLLAVLQAATDDPGVLDTAYPAAVGHLAGALARALEDGRIRDAEAREILRQAARVVAENLALFVDEADGLAAAVAATVLDAVAEERGLRGEALTELVDEVLQIVAAHGRALLGEESVERLTERLRAVIEAGLRGARPALGQGLNVRMLPRLLGELVARWARDEVPSIALDDPEFTALLQELMASIPAR